MITRGPRRAFSALRQLSVIGAPYSLGQPLVGPDDAPNKLREHGLLRHAADAGWRVHDHRNIECVFHDSSRDSSSALANNSELVGQYCQTIRQQLKPIAESDDFILILGGDHSIPMGTLPAIRAARPNTGVVWVDAHSDINTTATSPSGNLHGMTVAVLMGLEPKLLTTPQFQWLAQSFAEDFSTGTGDSTAACLAPEDLIYVGLREVDPGEKAAIQSLGIKAYTMSDIDRLGIGRVMDEVCGYFASRDMDIHCSFDIDAIDPFWAPHTGTGVIGGLTFREGNYICEALHSTGRFTSLELVEVNPQLHADVGPEKTIEMSLTVICSALGRTIL